MNRVKERKKLCLHALKIAIGSCSAIYIATLLNLDYESSAGSITLLTLVTTKMETLKLSLYRVITFGLACIVAWFTFAGLTSEWIAYGIYIFIVGCVCEIMGWKATISVNAVIGTHFLMSRDFSAAFVLNEFLLVIIGIAIAIVLSLFQDNTKQQKDLIEHMRHTEAQLQMVMGEMAAYLYNKEMQRNVWEDIKVLEKELEYFIREAYLYQNNTFQSYSNYYSNYFEMRSKQCSVLHNLHYESKKIRKMPEQAIVIAEYIWYLTDFVVEINLPKEQLDKLHQTFRNLEKEPLPKSREEFESRAILYHMLMDIEEFLIFKQRFVEGLDEDQLKEYWRK